MLVGFSLPLQQQYVPLIPQAGCRSLNRDAVKIDHVGIGSWKNVKSNSMWLRTRHSRKTTSSQLKMNLDYSAMGRWTAGSAIQLTAISVTLAVLDISSPILNPVLTKVIAVVFFGTMAIRSRIFSPLVCDRPTPKRGSNDWEDVKAAGKPLMDIKRPSCNRPNTTLFQTTCSRFLRNTARVVVLVCIHASVVCEIVLRKCWPGYQGHLQSGSFLLCGQLSGSCAASRVP
mmetsp:Transcript_45417/g.95194  ORF Transcript_45417/g.95194 Transcript_45417/m.95194 type:complete len:229 (-) Transcript_45417:768-1454(-)